LRKTVIVIDDTLNLWRSISIKSWSHSLISDKEIRFLNCTHARNGEREYVISARVAHTRTGTHTHRTTYNDCVSA